MAVLHGNRQRAVSLGHMLKAAGHVITVVEEGPEALARAARRGPRPDPRRLVLRRHGPGGGRPGGAAQPGTRRVPAARPRPRGRGSADGRRRHHPRAGGPARAEHARAPGAAHGGRAAAPLGAQRGAGRPQPGLVDPLAGGRRRGPLRPAGAARGDDAARREGPRPAARPGAARPWSAQPPGYGVTPADVAQGAATRSRARPARSGTSASTGRSSRTTRPADPRLLPGPRGRLSACAPC